MCEGCEGCVTVCERCMSVCEGCVSVCEGCVSVCEGCVSGQVPPMHTAGRVSLREL